MLVGIPLNIASYAVGLKAWAAVTAEIKKHNPIIKEKESKHSIIILLPKNKVSNITDLIFTDLINSNISHNEFFQ